MGQDPSDVGRRVVLSGSASMALATLPARESAQAVPPLAAAPRCDVARIFSPPTTQMTRQNRKRHFRAPLCRSLAWIIAGSSMLTAPASGEMPRPPADGGQQVQQSQGNTPSTAVVAATESTSSSIDPLERGFHAPPDSAKPRVHARTLSRGGARYTGVRGVTGALTILADGPLEIRRGNAQGRLLARGQGRVVLAGARATEDLCLVNTGSAPIRVDRLTFEGA